MEGKTFQEFVDMAAEWGYRVYKTSPETALVVGSFLEQPMGYTFKEPDYTNQIKTTQLLDLSDGQKKCACCGMVYKDTPWSPFCIGCKRLFVEEEE